jgi:hypothetical protein
MRIFFDILYKLLSTNLIRREVITMAKDINEAKEKPEEKKTEVKSGSICSCGCGCIPTVKTRQ